MRKVAFLFFAILLLGACSKSDSSQPEETFVGNSIVKVDATLQSNMVIKQKSLFNITGEGTPGEKIRVTCSWLKNEKAVVVVDETGAWKVPVATPEASKTAHSIEVEGAITKTFSNILFGEVWLCAGQSNMYWPLKDAENGLGEVENAKYPLVRILKMDFVAADIPQNSFTAKWMPCNSGTIAYFSAVGYFFGRELHTKLDIPIGLIASSWGNTAIEVWTKESVVRNSAVLNADAVKREFPHSDGSPYRSGSAYNAMIHPLLNMPISGVIWYQGENNQDSPYVYPQFLEAMIEDWRSDWGVNFPLYVAQICPFQRMWDYETKYSNPAMRFMQSQAAEKISNAAIEVNDDIANIYDIHPLNKRDVGIRLANLALSKTYGLADYLSLRSPIYDRYVVNGNEITVYFKYADEGFKTTDGSSATLFEVAGDDGIFYPAAAVLQKGYVVLKSALVPNPAAARFGWSYTKVSNLRSANGLPVGVFKTYTWLDQAEES